MKNTYFKTVLALASLVFVFACSDEDDLTGDSTANPSNPSLSVSLDFPSSQNIVEMDASYDFTVTLSEPTIAAVDVKIAQTGGTATDGVDFEIPHSIRIAAGATSATGTITIFEDDLAEETENAIITIGSGFEANVSATNSQTVTFNITNLTDGDLAIGLDWATASTVTDNFGNEIGAYDAADLRLLLAATPDADNILDGADGASAETYVLDAAAPDGEYYVIADFYAAVDFPADLDLTLTFDQVGVINGQTHSFSAALNTGNSCSSVYYVLAKLTKAGDSYTFEEIGTNSPVTAAPFIGTATVVSDADWADYAPGDTLEIEEGANGQEFWIRGYDNPFINNPDTAYMIVTVDPLTGNATVTANEFFDFGVPIDINGTGVLNACSGLMTFTLDYTRPSDGAFYSSGAVFILEI